MADSYGMSAYASGASQGDVIQDEQCLTEKQLQREAQQPTEDVDFGGDRVHQSWDHSTLP